MQLPVVADPVPLSQDGPVIRVAGTRVTLDTIVAAFSRGDSAEEIAEGFSSLELADVYAVLSYYLHHRSEVDEYLARRARESETLQQEIEAEPGYQEYLQDLSARIEAARASRV